MSLVFEQPDPSLFLHMRFSFLLSVFWTVCVVIVVFSGYLLLCVLYVQGISFLRGFSKCNE